MYRDDTLKLFNKLQQTKEVQYVTSGTLATGLGAARLPDLESAPPSSETCLEHISDIIDAQQKAVMRAVADSDFGSILNKRQVTIARVLQAAADSSEHVMRKSTMALAKRKTLHIDQKKAVKNENAMMVLAVKTGLQLAFRLLKQSADSDDTSLVCDTLETARDTLLSLPPLSLSPSTSSSQLQSECLTRTEEFLNRWVTSNVDHVSQRAAELLLSISVQRGTLRHLLQFISSCLFNCTSISGSTLSPSLETIRTSIKSTNHAQLDLVYHDLQVVCQQMHTVPPDKVALLILSAIGNNSVESNTDSSSKGPDSTDQVHCWGSNSSQQLTDSVTEDKLLQPKLVTSFGKVSHVTAGQYCTFVVQSNGTVLANGKGSYGRLGTGISASSSRPVNISFNAPVASICSSKGSDGHSLAIGSNGELWSWGDGDYGKLGHGDSVTQKQPQLIESLRSRHVIQADCGHRHSACVTEDGGLFTWGEGDYGRLGLGDALQRAVPVQVNEIVNAGQVACGFNHTLVVARDGSTVWSFGAAENGKLGHGDTQRQFKPKVIDTFNDKIVRKVACGTQVSAAVTTDGQLYTWGFGACIGGGLADETVLTPRLVTSLANFHIVDVAVGDNHIIALSIDSKVFTWGNNQNGQCGIGNTISTVCTPQLLASLTGVPVKQITAGTTHSIVWCASPPEGLGMAQHKPFELDIHGDTFTNLRQLLQRYAITDKEHVIAPFTTREEQDQFVISALQLLKKHLAAAKQASNVSNAPILSQSETTELRNFLFGCLDADFPTEMADLVESCVSAGTQLLMPDVEIRVEGLIIFFLKNSTNVNL